MKRADILGWFTDICLGWIMLLVLITLTKLASDFLTTPNVFGKAEVLNQKQTDDMCGAWWFNTNVAEAKKRICGK
jgi:hypothetical protein